MFHQFLPVVEVVSTVVEVVGIVVEVVGAKIKIITNEFPNCNMDTNFQPSKFI